MADLTKRDPGLEIILVPYGAGWTDVYLNIGADKLYFIASNSMDSSFSQLVEALYYLNPDLVEYIDNARVDYWEAVYDKNDNFVGIFEHYDPSEDEFPFGVRAIPKSITFCWDEEGSESVWRLEREPTQDTDFMVKLCIDINRATKEHYEFQIRYKDLCYTVAKTLTQVLKSHGIMGYHRSTYTDDINMRQFLFLKAIALDYLDIQKYVDLGDGKGEATNFEKELELLLFDM